MAIKQTTSKTLAIRAFINTWLKDQTLYCANCGDVWNPSFHIYESCCERPQFGRNIDHIRACIKQNKDIRDSRLKETGGNKDNTMRMAVSMPPNLLMDLEEYFKKHGEKLFNTPKELHAFMKAFPEFTSCRKI